MLTNNTLFLLGYASGIAAADPGSAEGPPQLRKSIHFAKLASLGIRLQWQAMIHPTLPDSTPKLTRINQQCSRLADEVAKQAKQKHFFTVLGGDHACAIGTWSGVSRVTRPQGALGLIWIDAHMDSHTPATTPTGNIHGMPLACLLGHGEKSLTTLAGDQPVLLPQHVCIIGARSYEEGEQALLKGLGVRIFYMDEIKERGLAAVFAEAVQIVSKETFAYGISLDIDSMDPIDAPATGVAEPDGIAASELRQALTHVARDPKFIGAEIVEFDPHRDIDQRTEKLIPRLIAAMTVGTDL